MGWSFGLCLWSAGFLGFVLVDGLRRIPAPCDPCIEEQELRRFTLRCDPARMSARELTVLPSVGRRRAWSITAARRAHVCGEDPFTWKEVPGIGPRTESRVTEWLEERGFETTLCLCAARSVQSGPSGGR